MYSEIEQIVANGASQTIDTKAGVAIVTWGDNQWVSYDNNATLKQKMNYANGKCLGGVMVWAASTDDARGSAIQALNGAAGRTSFSQAALAKPPAPAFEQCVSQYIAYLRYRPLITFRSGEAATKPVLRA